MSGLAKRLRLPHAPPMRRVLKWLLGGFALLLLAGVILLAIGYRNARADPVVVDQRIELAGLERPVRVVLLSDTHYGWPDMRTGRLNRIVTQINAQRPDLILLAGDYMGGKWLDWPKSWLEEALPPLAALRAPLGVYAVLGNHDQPHWTNRVMARQVAPKLLVRSGAQAGPLWVQGFASSAHASDPGAMIRALPPGRPALLLMHEPEQLLWTVEKPRPGVVALAGHTHGGQVVIPGVGPASNLFGDDMLCPRGLCTINGWPVFVTSGIGTSTLPIRFGVPPEIVVLTLVPPDYSVGRKSGTER